MIYNTKSHTFAINLHQFLKLVRFSWFTWFTWCTNALFSLFAQFTQFALFTVHKKKIVSPSSLYHKVIYNTWSHTSAINPHHLLVRVGIWHIRMQLLPGSLPPSPVVSLGWGLGTRLLPQETRLGYEPCEPHEPCELCEPYEPCEPCKQCELWTMRTVWTVQTMRTVHLCTMWTTWTMRTICTM